MDRLPQVGQIIDGKYAIEGVLGSGGMGVVFSGRNLAGNFPVAIKWLKPELAEEPNARLRFRKEAQLAATIRCANTVQIYDVGTDAPYFVMERLEGRSLRDVLASSHGRPLEGADVAEIFPQILAGVQAAHEISSDSGRGVVHRDLKPDNVILATRGSRIVPTVVDFGIARIAEMRNEATQQLTGDRLLGTPQYMAKEQFFSQADVGPWTDVHALGVMLYEMLAGRRPFEQPPGTTAWQLISLIAQAQYEPLSAAIGQSYHPVYQQLDLILARAMHPEIGGRYRSVAALSADLLPPLRSLAQNSATLEFTADMPLPAPFAVSSTPVGSPRPRPLRAPAPIPTPVPMPMAVPLATPTPLPTARPYPPQPSAIRAPHAAPPYTAASDATDAPAAPHPALPPIMTSSPLPSFLSDPQANEQWKKEHRRTVRNGWIMTGLFMLIPLTINYCANHASLSDLAAMTAAPSSSQIQRPHRRHWLIRLVNYFTDKSEEEKTQSSSTPAK